MLRLAGGDTLSFSFPKVHKDAKLRIRFIRTLRVPDDVSYKFLPPCLEAFPLERTEDFKDKVPASWTQGKSFILPMRQSEALWICFDSPEKYPFAVRVGAGKLCAVTGEAWQGGLVQVKRLDDDGRKDNSQNYVSVPNQPWLDGFNAGHGVMHQFVAAPLSDAVTPDEKLAQKVAEFEDLQIQVYPLKAKARHRRGKSMPEVCFVPTCFEFQFGLEARGRQHQKLIEDDRELTDYDMANSSKVFVHILNSAAWTQVTGMPLKSAPLDANVYARALLPWLDCYEERPAVPESQKLAGDKLQEALKPEVEQDERARHVARMKELMRMLQGIDRELPMKERLQASRELVEEDQWLKDWDAAHGGDK